MRFIQSTLAFLASLFLFAVLVMETSALVVMAGFLYLSIYLFVAVNLFTSKKLTFAMHLFMIFFCIGHVIKTGTVILNKEIHAEIGWLTIGTFDFSIEAMTSLFMVETVTLIGGYFAIKKFLRKSFEFADIKQTFPFKRSTLLLLFIWFTFSIFLIIVISKLGFGAHGIQPSDDAALPFGIGGFLLYFRNLVVPSVGLVFLQWYARSNTSKKWVGYIAYIIVALTFSIYSLSRSAFVIAVIPLILFYVNNNAISLRRLVYLGFVAFILLASMSLVNRYRLSIYNLDTNIIGIIDLLSEIRITEVLLILGFIVDRIEGSRELMAVISSDIKGVSSLLEVFFYGSDRIIESIMGFIPRSEGMAFGLTYGMAGLLFISGNYLVVFMGTIAYLSLLFYVERLFIKRGYVMASIYISFLLFVNMWGNMDWFFLTRFTFMAFFTYTAIRFIHIRITRKSHAPTSIIH